MVNNALIYEMDRGGQVIYLHNTIENLGKIKEELNKEFPEVSITIAHGKMKPKLIEESMLRFSKCDAKVLLTTTIVESGIDIPNVNTIIISDCEKYGLAQLHQLRGRVGRSSTQAFAYFFYHKRDSLTDLAKKRMAAIVSHDSLGAGFQLASSDMALRGVGNLLGTEQSGDIDSIGIDRYLEMLEQAVHETKTGTPPRDLTPPEIRIREKAGIPHGYMPNDNERINLYRSLIKVDSETRLNEIFSLCKDLYGPWPKSFKNLYYISFIRIILTKIQAKSMRQLNENRIELTLIPKVGKEIQQLKKLQELGATVNILSRVLIKLYFK